MALLDDIRENLIDGDMNGVKEGVNQALADGIELAKVLNDALTSV